MTIHSNGASIPHTSRCEILTRGTINDGDTITIVSPIFQSIDFKSRDVNISSSLDVIIKLPHSIYITETTYATLVCDDNDVLSMYVKLSGACYDA